ncbi:MAG: hypothetical protein K2W82_02385 [Candidatus Obscuribacterales bacterium]|nr:hypothetical protein [Candidatus Obscuribacterales bacterium]
MKSQLASCLVVLVSCSQFAGLGILPASAVPVRFAGQEVIDISAAAGGLSASERADKIQRNIENSLVASNDRTANAVQIVYVKGQPVITLGGFYVATVDAASAKQAGVTPSVLADRWLQKMKLAMANKSAVDQFVNQLTGTASDITVGSADTHTGSTVPYYQRGKVVYVPAGMTLPVKLVTAVTSATAKPGDLIEAELAETVVLGDAIIPAGSRIRGQITESASGNRMSKAGTLGMKFNGIRTLDGNETAIDAHIVGTVAGYTEKGDDRSDIFAGENSKDKMKRALIGGAVGAGAGAVLGTTIGAISGRGRGAGRGAWSGLAIGAGLGVAESLLLRKGSDVTLSQGTTLKLQLDSPASLAVANASNI